MSVLDTIKEAEAKAQQEKARASQEAKETLAKAQEIARGDAATVCDEAQRQADALLLETRNRIAEETRRVIAKNKAEDEADARAAEQNLPQAVSLIIERIEKP